MLAFNFIHFIFFSFVISSSSIGLFRSILNNLQWLTIFATQLGKTGSNLAYGVGSHSSQTQFCLWMNSELFFLKWGYNKSQPIQPCNWPLFLLSFLKWLVLVYKEVVICMVHNGSNQVRFPSRNKRKRLFASKVYFW